MKNFLNRQEHKERKDAKKIPMRPLALMDIANICTIEIFKPDANFDFFACSALFAVKSKSA